MNLAESDKFVEAQRQNEKKKKIVLVSIILCAILIALLLVFIIYIQYQDSLELKLYIDGEQKQIGSSLIKTSGDTNYINIKEFAEMLGFTYTKGEYAKYNEDEKSCYVSNAFEITAMTADEDTFTKYIQVDPEAPELTAEEGVFGIEVQVKSENGKFNTFNTDKPVKFIDGQLYLPFELVTDVFDVSVNTSEKNRIRIYTLPTLFKNAVEVAGKLGYTNISGIYENIRAIPYNLVVVGNDNLYGVIDLSNNGQEILSIKYENLEFIQNTQEFFMSADNTVGLLDKDGKTIIKPMEYDEISVLDEVKQLYLVKKDNKYGVLNRKGEVVVHVDYDRIGLKDIDKFGNNVEDVRNLNLLYDECIIVGADSKYGLFDINGKELLKTNYDTLGYMVPEEDTSGVSSTLLIPEETGIRGIVVCFNGLYGIYDINVKNLIIPCACTRIYSITRAGTTTYYMEFNGEQMELNNYLVAYNLKSVGKTNTDDENDSTDVTENTSAEPTEEGSQATENPEKATQTNPDTAETVDTSNPAKTTQADSEESSEN